MLKSVKNLVGDVSLHYSPGPGARIGNASAPEMRRNSVLEESQAVNNRLVLLLLDLLYGLLVWDLPRLDRLLVLNLAWLHVPPVRAEVVPDKPRELLLACHAGMHGLDYHPVGLCALYDLHELLFRKK